MSKSKQKIVIKEVKNEEIDMATRAQLGIVTEKNYYQLLIASYTDELSTNICISHLNRNGIVGQPIKEEGWIHVVSERCSFKHNIRKVKDRVEELKYNPVFI